MSTPVIDLTDEQLLSIMRQRRDLRARAEREDLKDKSYQLLPLGVEVAGFLRAIGKRNAKNTLDAYESTLDKLARHFADLELKDFEPPVGTERLEEFLDAEWGSAKSSTYNRHLAALAAFFGHFTARGRLQGDPTKLIRRAREQQPFRSTFSTDQRRAIIASQDNLRDRIALRLLLHYGLRRGGLQKVQFKHFDHVRKRVAVFLKGGKVRNVPIPEPAFWHDLERLILDQQAAPDHFLMCATRRNRYGTKPLLGKAMSGNGIHKWWYRCLANAGIVPEGTSSGERMHKARHTAGQTVLDRTGNLKAVQRLLGHASIQTTADVYTDWDDDALAVTMRDVLMEEDA